MKNIEMKNCCSFCGKREHLFEKSIVCISETEYSLGGIRNYINQDNSEEWQVFLCENCLPQARKVNIQNQLKRELKKALFGLLSIAVAILMFLHANQSEMLVSLGKSYDLIETAVRGPLTYLNLMFLGLMVVCFLVGIVFFTYGISISLIIFFKLSFVNPINKTSNKWFNDCFVGAGEKILKCLEIKDKTDIKIYENFKLPSFKSYDELSLDESIKAMEFNKCVGSKKRKIVQKLG